MVSNVTRRSLLQSAWPLLAQDVAKPPPALDFICPMDREVRNANPGKCPRCGMKLVANLPDGREYRLDLRTSPAVPRAGKPVELRLAVRHPVTGAVVRDFEVIHEKIFHLFLVSQDLSYFAHEHPEQKRDGTFVFKTRLPAAGAYRVVADCLPKGASIQFLSRTLVTAGTDPARLADSAVLQPVLSAQQGTNLGVELVTEPKQPLAGLETLLFFNLSPADGLEQYLAAWGHMLVASADLIDLVHDHPLYADGGPKVQFNLIFPRETNYRIWVQFQRRGVVNTVAFNVPVKALR
ncbi:MAG: hypothetical protein FJW39_27185 [Acidobacteria bacterium]|nr:hypothetical protein [Acidobacteriota bacterium]